MNEPHPPRISSILALTALACALAACEKAPAPPPGPVKPRPTAWAEPLAIGPISYFNAQCTACHGKYGTLLVDHNIARNAPGSEYRSIVEYMVTDRAGSSLALRELDAQTSYCMSLAAVGEGVLSEGSPLFIAVKSPINQGGLEGEVTPGCTVTLVTGKGEVRVNATVDGHTWSITPMQVGNAKSSAGDDWVNATLEARSKGVREPQVLRLSEEAFKGPVLKKGRD